EILMAVALSGVAGIIAGGLSAVPGGRNDISQTLHEEGGELSAPNKFIIRCGGGGKTEPMGSEVVDGRQEIGPPAGAGGFVALMGPSGCGKTTLLNLFGCIDVPTSGSLHVFGEDAATMSDGRRASLRLHRIGFVFQRFYLLPMLTAFENVELPMIEARVPR